jgi:peptide methionine sulfoxide reductase msrA/msrB
MKYLLFSLFFSFNAYSTIKTATFAGGCFWCIESVFDDKPGIVSAISGYSGGSEENADYKKVSSGQTKHLEAVQVKYDDKKTNYKTLLEIFWRAIDPTDAGGQFADRGAHYKTAIFYENDEQKKLALESIKILEKDKIFRRKIVVPVIRFKNFFPAEKNHQDYHKKNPIRYKSYFYGSGRGNFIDITWSDKKNYKIFK